MSISIELPRLRPDQFEIIKHPAKRKKVAMGRRWGKTVLGEVIVLNVLRQHGKAAWLVPTYKNARPLWRIVSNACAPLAQAKLLDISKSERVVTTHLGGFLGVYSADNIDAMRGEDFDVLVTDEAARVDGETKEDVTEATLADRDGDGIDISSPKGRNWFFLDWLAAQQDTTGYSASWQAPTSANPSHNIQAAFARVKLKTEQGLYSKRSFLQEWLAQFIDDGSFFSNVIACATAFEHITPMPGHTYLMGVDWARASGGDDSIFTVLDATTKSVARLVKLNGKPFKDQLEVIQGLHKEFGIEQIIAEYNSLGMKPVEDLQAAGLPVVPFTTTAASKHEIMTALESAFDKKEISILNDLTLTSQLQAFEVHQRAGLPAYSAPEGMHDDCVMSLALAWYGVASAMTGQLFF